MKTITISFLFILFNIFSFAQDAAYAHIDSIFPKRIKNLYYNTPSKDSIFIKIHQELDFIQITKYDTIADIGSDDGYYPALYSIFSDSVVFYLNDLDNLDFTYFDSLLAVCSKIKTNKISNSFLIVIGNDTCTKLPEHLFNKVIIRESFHHFKLKQTMLEDIRKIMKPNAKLILKEEYKEPNSNNTDLCPLAMTREEILSALDKAGFKLIKESSVLKKRCWLEFEIK